MKEISIEKGNYYICDKDGRIRKYLPCGHTDFASMKIRIDNDCILREIEENE